MAEPPYPYQPEQAVGVDYKARIAELRECAPGVVEFISAAITEEWLAEVGFKYREPGERQQWKHWTLTFAEHDDHGLYIETTAPGWLNRNGDLINGDSGWFLWIGRGTQHLHLRHVFERSEIVAVVEALTGEPWIPSRMGHVPVKRRPAKS